MSSLTEAVMEESRNGVCEEVFEDLVKKEKQALRKRLKDWKILRNK